MPKNKKSARKKKSSRRPAKFVAKFQVEIGPSMRDLADVEKAIAEKLRTQPTDLFTKNETVVIVCEQIGWKRHPGQK